MPHSYEKDGAAIYAESFATIRNEADLARFSEIEEVVVVRMIHAAGMVDLASFVQFTSDFAVSAKTKSCLEFNCPKFGFILTNNPSPDFIGRRAEGHQPFAAGRLMPEFQYRRE